MAMQLSKQQQQYVGAGGVLFLVFIGVYVKFFWLPIAQAKADYHPGRMFASVALLVLLLFAVA